MHNDKTDDSSLRADSEVKIEIGLNAVILRVTDGAPEVLMVATSGGWELPFGPFIPEQHRTMENGLRSWVSRRAGLELGYVEQLYTFGNRGRYRSLERPDSQVVSIGYLALTKGHLQPGEWKSFYEYLPWEDWRTGQPECLSSTILPDLKKWLKTSPKSYDSRVPSPTERARDYFGTNSSAWDEESALERYELLYEAGLLAEAKRDARPDSQSETMRQENVSDKQVKAIWGEPMRADHRRILATALGRIRGKLQYRPVIFELLPEEFTLSTLQSATESILGRRLHMQNFRRQIMRSKTVESTGKTTTATGGRPASLYRFRRGTTDRHTIESHIYSAGQQPANVTRISRN